MRLSMFGHHGIIHFSFAGQIRSLTRDGKVDRVQIPHLTMTARYNAVHINTRDPAEQSTTASPASSAIF